MGAGQYGTLYDSQGEDVAQKIFHTACIEIFSHLPLQAFGIGQCLDKYLERDKNCQKTI